MSSIKEHRFLPLDLAEIRSEEGEAEGECKPLIVSGVAHRYGSQSVPMKDPKGRTFREKFRAGAFSGALATADVRLLINHDKNLVMGRTRSGTLTIADDPDALRFTVVFPPTDLAEHYHCQIGRRDLDGVSFLFYALKDRWTQGAGGLEREVIEADIAEISIVTFPAYVESFADARSADHIAAAIDAHQAAAARRAAHVRNRLRLAQSF